jgi:hypothetical protein
MAAKEEIFRLQGTADVLDGKTSFTAGMSQTDKATNEGDPFSGNKLLLVSKEMQYSLLIMLVVVLFLWNKRRMRQKISGRSQ